MQAVRFIVTFIKNNKELSLGVLLWVGWLVYIWSGITLAYERPPFLMVSGLGLAALFITFNYIFIAPLPWTKLPTRWPILVRFILAIALYVASIATVVFVNAGLGRNMGFRGTVKRTFRINLPRHLPLMVFFGIFLSCWQKQEKERKAMATELQTAKNLLLYGQLTPHTLFNALGAIAQLIHEGSPKAESSVESLARYFQGVMYATEKERATLAEERILMSSYLDFESARLCDRLQVEWCWDDCMDRLLVPPLLFQPLIENAIKHGVAKSVEGGVLQVIAERTATGVRLATRNTGRPYVAKESKGVGVKNLRSRLLLAYGKNAEFRIYSDGKWTVAEITINSGMLMVADGCDGSKPTPLSPLVDEPSYRV